MNRVQLRKGLHLLLHGQEYSVEKRLPTGEVLLNNLLTKVRSNLKETVLTQLLFEGELQFLDSGRSEAKHTSKKRFSHSDFTQLPERLREEAKRKHSYVTKVLELTPDKQTAETLKPVIAEVSNEIEDSKPPSWLTLYRWHKNYIASDKDIRSLVMLFLCV